MGWEDPDTAAWFNLKDIVFVKNPVLIIWKPWIQIKPVEYIQVENAFGSIWRKLLEMVAGIPTVAGCLRMF